MSVAEQEAHAKETATLTAQHQIDLTQVQAASSKQEEIAADLEQRMSQLKLKHEESMSELAKQQELSLKQAQDAGNDAVKVNADNPRNTCSAPMARLLTFFTLLCRKSSLLWIPGSKT